MNHLMRENMKVPSFIISLRNKHIHIGTLKCYLTECLDEYIHRSMKQLRFQLTCHKIAYDM